MHTSYTALCELAMIKSLKQFMWCHQLAKVWLKQSTIAYSAQLFS
jgi:hypothetical protein